MVFFRAANLKIIIMTLLMVMIMPSAISATKTHTTHAVKKISHKNIPVKKIKPKPKAKSIQKTKPILKSKHPQKSKALTRKPTRQTALPAQVSASNHTSNIPRSLLPSYLLSTIEKNLVSFVRNTVDSINYTKYKLGGTRIEPKRGVYIVDCSSYVDHILKTVYPRAYSSLTRWSGSQKPTTNDFYHYFRNLSDDSRHWNSVDDADDLRPGDILVFRNKNRYGEETGGHVMIIMDMPERNGNTLILQIADSAPSGHSQDTRSPHSSGIGIGTMLLKINPVTSQPYAYAWKLGARWQSNVNFAMARPLDLS